MIRNSMRGVGRCCCMLIVVIGITSDALAEEANVSKESYRYYYVGADVVSLDAKQSLSSYRAFGHVSGTSGATIGCSSPSTGISIALLVKSDHFYADVTTTNLSKAKDAKQPPDEKKQRVDLTNLRPVSIDLGADKDGRVYLLNLVPTVKTQRVTGKPFQEVADDLYQLKFHMSRVTLNDKQYVGNVLASGSDYISMEVCGVASIEFSLRHMKDAKPWGTLTDGQITIADPDGTSIAISNVANGKENRLVTGGPYTVWVRWKKPQTTVEEYRAALKGWRDEMAKAVGTPLGGDTKSDALKRIDQELAREPGPWVVGCGAHDLQKKEFVRDE